MRALGAEQLTAIAQTHLTGLHNYIDLINAALARANVEGAELQKAERKRIWNR